MRYSSPSFSSSRRPGLPSSSREVTSQAIAISFFGSILAVMFMAFQSPDVALSQVVIGAVGLPLMILLAGQTSAGLTASPGKRKRKIDEPPVATHHLPDRRGSPGTSVGGRFDSPSGSCAIFATGIFFNSTLRTFPERNVTDIVTAVNFDYRGFDTVGEEFILFASVLGSTPTLLRQADEKKTKPLCDVLSPGRDIGPSDAMRLWILAMVGPKIAFGIYIVIHGRRLLPVGLSGRRCRFSATDHLPRPQFPDLQTHYDSSADRNR